MFIITLRSTDTIMLILSRQLLSGVAKGAMALPKFCFYKILALLQFFLLLQDKLIY